MVSSVTQTCERFLLPILIASALLAVVHHREQAHGCRLAGIAIIYALAGGVYFFLGSMLIPSEERWPTARKWVGAVVFVGFFVGEALALKEVYGVDSVLERAVVASIQVGLIFFVCSLLRGRKREDGGPSTGTS